MNLFNTTFILAITLVLLPMFLSTSPLSNHSFASYTKSLMALAFALSMIPYLMFMYSHHETIISNWHWISITSLPMKMSFKLDFFSITFMPVALFVTWSIMEFSTWYMHTDPHINSFFKHLLLFLITMLILVTANNLFQLFVGWEGVGIMSFLLIGWWHGRTEANTAALQAILYNRIGDVGFILSMAWFLLYTNSWDFQHIFMMDDNNFTSNIPLLGLLLAATGKSAQFGLHPWLPSAMEGPTPVSALLHSSTMVVAGVFLLIRFNPLIHSNSLIQTTTLCLGAMTTLFTALCALTQNDIKKIIAFSTSSQLGLMMVTIGINQPYMAFLHICTHAFFKAMLFMCSGSIIHNLNNEQDIRKMSGLHKSLPLTSSCLTIGSLALTGMPFLTGFFSKDLIIETMNISHTNTWAILTTLFATSLTAVYSTRIIFYTTMNKPMFNPYTNMNEMDPNLANSIKRLALGSIIAGFLIINTLPPMTTPQMTMPSYLKLTALLVSILGFSIAMELSHLTHFIKLTSPNKQMLFSTLLGYYPYTTHRMLPSLYLLTSQNIATTSMDQTGLENMMPKNITKYQTIASTKTSNQQGLVKLYFMSLTVSLITMTLLIS
uniref:NADH-ubiquinone oxidoreductase chain 5 n=1 Tax=Laonastes aenigmamus TaxID=340180 RepID=A0A342KAQ8_9HYST|nr:NADH dehydrogenase subunit 5 [Laonastes aenigmamus]ANC48892.1 NADH dehydrogenase subunit 5 [Laonastes aenigmamus]ANC48905.1 NADH dehydrogenase subunit 5 [Laonastes aenigmamus]